MLDFDTSYLNQKISKNNMIKKYQKIVSGIYKKIADKTALGCEMTGWLKPTEVVNQKLITVIHDAIQNEHLQSRQPKFRISG